MTPGTTEAHGLVSHQHARTAGCLTATVGRTPAGTSPCCLHRVLPALTWSAGAVSACLRRMGHTRRHGPPPQNHGSPARFCKAAAGQSGWAGIKITVLQLRNKTLVWPSPSRTSQIPDSFPKRPLRPADKTPSPSGGQGPGSDTHPRAGRKVAGRLASKSQVRQAAQTPTEDGEHPEPPAPRPLT